MVAPRFRKAKARKRKSPAGRKVLKYKKDKPKKRKCGVCHALLHGVPSEQRKLSKTQKRPERIFAGVLCAKCTERVVRLKARLDNGLLDESGVPLTYLNYVKQIKTKN